MRLSAIWRESTFVAAIVFASIAAAEPLVLEVADAQPAFDQRSNEPIVTFRLTPASARRFADFTRENVGRTVDVRVDGRMVMSSVIREPILGGFGQISGGFGVKEAKEMAERFAAGKARLELALRE